MLLKKFLSLTVAVKCLLSMGIANNVNLQLSVASSTKTHQPLAGSHNSPVITVSKQAVGCRTAAESYTPLSRVNFNFHSSSCTNQISTQIEYLNTTSKHLLHQLLTNCSPPQQG